MRFLLAVPCAASVAFGIFALYAAGRFFRARRRGEAAFLPSVSILKSVRGLDRGAYDNMASFCRQDYPCFQVLFGVRDGQDPAVPVIRRLMRDFPRTDIRLVLCGRDRGTNPKMSNLVQMESAAAHPYLLLCDSDIRVERDYLRRVIQPMADPAVGAVTCMCRSLSKGWLAALEALREATEFCPGVLVARRIEGMKFGLGSAILASRAALERIGGLASVADYLADDLLLGSRISKAGFKVLLSEVVVEHDLCVSGLGALIQRQIRWNRGIRVCRPWGYRGLLLTYGVPISLLLLLAAGGAAWSWALAGAVWAVRLAVAWRIGVGYLGSRTVRRCLWAVPLQDLFSFSLWCVSLFGRRIRWRDQSFTLTGSGKLIRVQPVGPALSSGYDRAPLAAASQ